MIHRPASPTAERLSAMYHLLLDHFGPQGWWPAETPLEMMAGAVLTQNTNWANAKKALDKLERLGLLDVGSLSAVGVEDLALAIRPAGYYNLKARRLKNLVRLIAERYEGDLNAMLAEDAVDLRSALLGVNGIGPETADSIVLYAAGHPVFVVDAYTHRLLSRHGLVDESASYDEIQETFSDNLPQEVDLFQEFHALIVRAGKTYCRKRPQCDRCPLEALGGRVA